MTRASLLHILNHVGDISEAEVRELEQLAAAFPYCQTAHVLLAKAAHDQGSMLASQRLRRAATYAVDRQLLRQLLEHPAPAEVPATVELPAPTAVASSSTAFLQTLVAEDVQALEPQESPIVTSAEEIEPDTSAVELPEADPEVIPVFASEPVPPAQSPEDSAASTQESQDEPTASVMAAELLNSPEAAELPEPPAAPATDQLPAAPAPETAALPIETAPTASPAATGPSDSGSDELLPALAPPIRPPADAGSSRFEFGLSETTTPLVPILYQLPGLAEDEDEEVAPASGEAALPGPTALAPPFRVDTDLAYGLLPEGSRGGYALQLRDKELTCSLPATEFFPPDALLHAHSLQRPSATAPSSLDLINRFLKVQPRLKSPAVLPTVQEQDDLAARSTLNQPALASESLAKILIKQGKPDRAIKIYEQLMVRQPEKSAYFADQIQQLKTSE